MKYLWLSGIGGAAASIIVAGAIAATDLRSDLSWAFPTLASPGATPPLAVHRLPGSDRRYTEAQLHDMFHAVDWRPGRSPPAIVTDGRASSVMACGFCHLPRGQGRPENAALAGLPADYIAAQVAAMRAGLRNGIHADWPPVALMHQVALAASPREVRTAAAWFAGQHFTGRTRVVEARIAPGARPAAGVYRFDPAAPRLTLTSRIVEGPNDFQRFELRDDTVGYTAYVPQGAVARGARLAVSGVRAEACADCHGAALNGGVGPPIAGRSPTWLFRQLYAFKAGVRREPNASTMVRELARLQPDDLIDLAAYAGSRPAT